MTNIRTYTINSSPEHLVRGNPGDMFYRGGDSTFLLIDDGGAQHILHLVPANFFPGYTLPFYARSVLAFATDQEMWIKSTGYNTDTGWVFVSNDSPFVSIPFGNQALGWIFPCPINSADPIGVEGNRSYDENFFYVKQGGIWTRSPLTLYTFGAADSGDQPGLYTSLPFMNGARFTPLPTSSYTADSSTLGLQTYDDEYYYIKNSEWERTALILFNPSKMTAF